MERNGERNETQRAHAVNLWPIGFAALATLALISVLAFIDTSDMRDAVRVYTLALAVPICPVVAQRTLRLWRAKYVNPHRAAFGGIGLIAMLLVVISSTFDSWGYHWVYPVNISARIAGLLAIYYAWSVYSKRPSDTLF